MINITIGGVRSDVSVSVTPLVSRLMTHDGDQVRVLTSSYPGLTLTMAITGQPPG